MVISLKVRRCSPTKDGDIAMKFYLEQNNIKLSVEYLYIIVCKNGVIVFVSSFPTPTTQLQQKKRGEQVVLHFDPSFCVPTLTTKNVDVRVSGKARFQAYMVWGYSFLFGNTYVRPGKWSKIHKHQTQNSKIYGIKILNKKEKLFKKKAETPI